MNKRKEEFPTFSPSKHFKSKFPMVHKTTFNDQIYESIQMSGLCKAIIDTPEFQRLEHLKQLGVCNYVYRNASHTRFSHSLGVAHLAEKMITEIKKNQPHWDISTRDIVCIKVAGLCHDLGHGPFSHVYDGVFMKRMYPKGVPSNTSSSSNSSSSSNDSTSGSGSSSGTQKRWNHEEGSVQMLNYILTKNNINLRDYDIDEVRDKLFIEEMILGTPMNKRKGRKSSKFYLYDIVNNIRSGLDVDKLDYLIRDMNMSNVAFARTFGRFITLARVMKTLNTPKPRYSRSYSSQNAAVNAKDEDIMICYPEKVVDEVIQVFNSRYKMHQTVYTHKAVKQIEFMLTDAMVEADPYIFYQGSIMTFPYYHPDGLYKMSECWQDMQAMSCLNDSVIHIIQYDRNPKLQKAQSIIERINRRDLYACVGVTCFQSNHDVNNLSEESIKKEIIEAWEQIQQTRINGVMNSNNNSNNGLCNNTAAIDDNFEFIDDNNVIGFSQDINNAYYAEYFNNDTNFSSVDYDTPLTAEDFIVEKMHVHHGQKGQDPIKNLRFYTKYDNELDPNAIAYQLKRSSYNASLPRVFEDKKIRLFARDKENVLKIRKAFGKWCRSHTHPLPYPFPSIDEEEDDGDDDGDNGNQEHDDDDEKEKEGDDDNGNKDDDENEDDDSILINNDNNNNTYNRSSFDSPNH